MKNFSNQKGITMVTLTIAIIILVLISNILVYNAKDGVYARQLENMYNDIESLRNKVIEFNIQYGSLPAYTENEYDLSSNSDLYNNWLNQEETNGKFYVIDLKVLEGISLNFGKDYSQISSSTTTEQLRKYTDIYVVNDITQNVFYVEGVRVDGKRYYSDRQKDDTQIDVKYPEGIEQVTTQIAEQVTANNYGDYVNYNYDINGDGDTTNDWKIFYNNGTNVYLIAASYLPNEKIPQDKGAIKKSAGSYGVQWNIPSRTFTDVTEAISNKFFSNTYKQAYPNSEANNARVVADILDTSIWNNYVVIDGAEAVGSPTIEMWIKSWNEKGYEKLYCDNVGENGYYLGTSSKPTAFEFEQVTQVLTNSEGLNDSLYFPTTVQDCNSYYLSSPADVKGNINGEELITVGNKEISHFMYYNAVEGANIGIGIRPVVCLPSSVKGVKEDNQIWRLD